jgi:hypothetical protein
MTVGAGSLIDTWVTTLLTSAVPSLPIAKRGQRSSVREQYFCQLTGGYSKKSCTDLALSHREC